MIRNKNSRVAKERSSRKRVVAVKRQRGTVQGLLGRWLYPWKMRQVVLEREAGRDNALVGVFARTEQA